MEGDERGQSLRYHGFARSIWNLNEESDWHQVEGAFLVQVTEALHDHQKIVLLCKQLVVLEMVDHLLTYLVLGRSRWMVLRVFFSNL